MTECSIQPDLFPTCKSRKIHASFDGGCVTSDGGSLLLRQADRRVALTQKLSNLLEDPRRQASCDHSLRDLLRQRIYGLVLGYEDLNDHDSLRHDVCLQTAVERDQKLGSSSTLCRLENRMDCQAAWEMNALLVEQFIGSFTKEPEELVLDFDATDDRVHGDQEGRFFHGYYDHYCFLPLYVFCGEHLLVSYLRPSRIDGAKHALGILSLLVKRLREQWPGVRIILRGDSGFCRWRTMSWCERNDVFYLLGLAKNNRINQKAEQYRDKAAARYEATGTKQRLFSSVKYAAGTWKRERRVIVKAEHTSKGANPRYVVTNLPGRARDLYKRYCHRGDMENRIKEQQLHLFSDRTSAHRWWANQFRMLLSSYAYVLLHTIRRLGLQGTKLARAQCHTIRWKLLKIGAVITRNTRRIRIHFSSGCTHEAIFWTVAERLALS